MFPMWAYRKLQAIHLNKQKSFQAVHLVHLNKQKKFQLYLQHDAKITKSRITSIVPHASHLISEYTQSFAAL